MCCASNRTKPSLQVVRVMDWFRTRIGYMHSAAVPAAFARMDWEFTVAGLARRADEVRVPALPNPVLQKRERGYCPIDCILFKLLACGQARQQLHIRGPAGLGWVAVRSKKSPACRGGYTRPAFNQRPRRRECGRAGSSRSAWDWCLQALERHLRIVLRAQNNMRNVLEMRMDTAQAATKIIAKTSVWTFGAREQKRFPTDCRNVGWSNWPATSKQSGRSWPNSRL